MKISELIDELNTLRQTYGDVEVETFEGDSSAPQILVLTNGTTRVIL